VILSDLSIDELEGVIAVLGSSVKGVAANIADGEFRKIKGVPVVYPGDKGKYVKLLELNNGTYESLPVKEAFPENPKLVAVINDFMDSIINDPSLQKSFKRNFEDYDLNHMVLDGKNGFIGSENCKDCHLKEYMQYETTRHFHAMDSLLQVKRDFHPDCVRCHVTGFGYPSGYDMKGRQAHVKQVGCESCHGPGGKHYKNPSPDNILRKVRENRCEVCHDQENSPEFDYDEYLPKVDHTKTTQTAEAEAISPQEKVRVELFVMSQCYFGMRAQNAMLPMIEQLGDKVDFQMHFIASDVEDKLKKQREEASEEGSLKLKNAPEKKKEAPKQATPGCNATFELDPNAKFQSLHGQGEVDEDIRQLLILKEYGLKVLLPYILERNKNIYADWKPVAKAHKIDVAKIEKGMEDGTGDAVFRANIKVTNDLGITASPTMRINGVYYNKPFEATPLQYAFCQGLKDGGEFCKDCAICSSDTHCRKTGKKGVCVNAGKPNARCDYEEPPEVPMVIIRDNDCALCETGPLLRKIFQVFPGLDVVFLDKNSHRAKKWIDKLRIDRYPFFIFEELEPQKYDEAKYLGQYLAFYNDTYFINPYAQEVAALDAEEKKGMLRLYTTTLSRGVEVEGQLLDVIEKMEAEGEQIDFKVIPLVTQSRKPVKAGEKDERLPIKVMDASGRSQSIYVESYFGAPELEEAMVQSCMEMNLDKKDYRTYLRTIAGEVVSKLNGLKEKADMKSVIDAWDLNDTRAKILMDLGIKAEQVAKIEQCRTSVAAQQALVYSMIESLDKRVNASPTLIINNNLYVRGVPPHLLNILPQLLKGTYDR
jgi:hypothetical protein